MRMLRRDYSIIPLPTVILERSEGSESAERATRKLAFSKGEKVAPEATDEDADQSGSHICAVENDDSISLLLLGEGSLERHFRFRA